MFYMFILLPGPHSKEGKTKRWLESLGGLGVTRTKGSGPERDCRAGFPAQPLGSCLHESSEPWRFQASVVRSMWTEPRQWRCGISSSCWCRWLITGHRTRPRGRGAPPPPPPPPEVWSGGRGPDSGQTLAGAGACTDCTLRWELFIMTLDDCAYFYGFLFTLAMLILF